jgi:hypothetical protein
VETQEVAEKYNIISPEPEFQKLTELRNSLPHQLKQVSHLSYAAPIQQRPMPYQ